MEYYSPLEEAWDKVITRKYKPTPSPLFTSCLKNVANRIIDNKIQLYFDAILLDFAEGIKDIDLTDMYELGQIKRNAIMEAQFILGRLPKTNPAYCLLEQTVQEGLDTIIRKAKEVKINESESV